MQSLHTEYSRTAELIASAERTVREKYGRVPLVYIRSFGCSQNAGDAEKISGIFAAMGFEPASSAEFADVVIYNTCAVRENAQQKIFGMIGELKKLKADNPDMIVGLCGCMVQQPAVVEKLGRVYPHVELIFGPHAIGRLPELFSRKLTGEKRVVCTPESAEEPEEDLPVLRASSVSALVTIMHGCDNFCSYCIVPYVRGREKSRKSQHILKEIRELVAAGCKEITLLGQNVNSYGKGLEEEITFAGLLRMINEIPGDFLVRFMTSHPKDCTPELITAIAECDRVAKHLHLPVQSGSDRILAAMNRGYTREDYLRTVRLAKEKIPGLVLSGDFIVGFPGETREDFEATLELVQKVRYEKLFTFIYSRRSGTKAEKLPDDTPHAQKAAYLGELIDLQADITLKHHEAMVGLEFRVLLEEKKGEGRYSAKTEGSVAVNVLSSHELIPGFYNVRITRSHRHAVDAEVL